jgi:predicted peroxiredoxin
MKRQIKSFGDSGERISDNSKTQEQAVEIYALIEGVRLIAKVIVDRCQVKGKFSVTGINQMRSGRLKPQTY